MENSNLSASKIMVVVLILLVLGLAGYLYYDKVYQKSSQGSGGSTGSDQTQQNKEIEEMLAKTIFGKIMEINSDMIKIELAMDTTGFDSKEKEVKIDANTQFKKSQPIEGQGQAYSLVEAKIEDFKADDYVKITTNKDPKQKDVTAETIELVTFPEPESIPTS